MNWDYCTYVPLLYEAARVTDGDVVELGVGLCSTPLLHALVTYGPKPRKLWSVDDDEGWISVMHSHNKNEVHEFIHVVDWKKNLVTLAASKPSLVFIDAGSVKDIPKAKVIRRYKIDLFCESEVLVVHDASNVLNIQTSRAIDLFELKKKFHYVFVDSHAEPTTLWLSNTKIPEFLMQRH